MYLKIKQDKNKHDIGNYLYVKMTAYKSIFVNSIPDKKKNTDDLLKKIVKK